MQSKYWGKVKLFLIFAICFNCEAVGQLNFLELNPQYSSYMEHAVLQDYMEDPVLLKQLRHKWKRKKDFRIRVFGDSHIASDFITSELRSIFGNINSVGFTYPLMPLYHQNLLVTYHSDDFSILDSRKINDYDDYPMGGIVAYPEKLPASISLSINAKQIKSWNSNFITKVVFKNSDTKQALRIDDAESKSYILHASRSNEWEIANLQLHFPITINALSKDVKLGGYFIYKEKESNIVEHLGINGVRSDIWKKWNKEILEKELKVLDYDIIMLCYGSNDAMYDLLKEERFIEYYRDFIKILKENNPNAIIILVSPPPVFVSSGNSKTTYQITKTFLPVKQTITRIAKMEHVMLFDMDDFIEKNGSKNSWTNLNLSKKDVHLTPQGYRLVAHGIYHAIANALKNL